MMSVEQERPNQVRFKNPPIVEAVLAITIKALPVSMIDAFHDAAPGFALLGYPLSAPVKNYNFGIEIENGVPRTHRSDEPVGLRFASSDSRLSVQFLRSGVVFSQLGHYESWELFTSEAKKAWSLFTHLVGEVELLSFQVRYINKVFVPFGIAINEYIKLYVEVPADLPQTITFQQMQLTFALPRPVGGVVTHRQATLPPERDGFATIMLDNDFLCPATESTLESLWSEIDSVREMKDDFFLEMLTDKMKETFNA